MQVQLCSISGEEEGSPLSHLFLKQSVFLNLWNKKLNFNETVSSLFEIMLIITEKDYKNFWGRFAFPFSYTHTFSYDVSWLEWFPQNRTDVFLKLYVTTAMRIIVPHFQVISCFSWSQPPTGTLSICIWMLNIFKINNVCKHILSDTTYVDKYQIEYNH